MDLAALKKTLLPQGSQPRRLPFGPARGLVMDIDFAHDTRLYLGVYEIELNRHLRAMARPGIDAFDVGGQHGYDALVLAKLTGGRVTSFEAEPAACARMRHTVSLNPALSERVAVVEAFVGTANGHLRLDDCAGTPGLLKVDVEGGELDVLRGASRLLREQRPALIVEVHSRSLEDACGALLVDHGYAPRIVNQRRVFREQRPLEHNRWLVCDPGPTNRRARATAT